MFQHLRHGFVAALVLGIAGHASAAVVLQHGFDFTSGDVAGNGGAVADDSGNSNDGSVNAGVGGAYSADLPSGDSVRNTTGVGSLNMTFADAVRTGTGAFSGEALNGLAPSDIDGSGGVTIEAWVKGVSASDDDDVSIDLGHLGVLGGMFGLVVNDAGEIQATYGDNIMNIEIPTAMVDVSDWTHIAAVFTDDPDTLTGVNGAPDSNLAFSRVELFANGRSVAVDADGHVFGFGFLERGFGYGDHPLFPGGDQAAGLIYEPTVSTGALIPAEFVTYAVPEPSSIAMLCIVALIGLRGRRRRG